MPHVTCSSPRPKSLRILPYEVGTHNNNNYPDDDTDIDVSKMKALFEQSPNNVNSSLATPVQSDMKEGRRGMQDSLGSIRSRLERTLLLGEVDDGVMVERQVSPGLQQLRITTGRAMKKQKLLQRKHHEAKSRAHTLGVGGGVSLWPQMDNMRLTCKEVAVLALCSVLLVFGSVALFQYLHGAVLNSFKSFNKQLTDFLALYRVSFTSQENLDESVLAWHLSFTNIMDSIHHEFDNQWSTTSGTYQLCALLYITSIGSLLYYLADNMFTTSRLTPQRIKIWVSLMVMTATWTVLMVFLLSQAQKLELKVEFIVHSFSSHLSDLVLLDLNLNRYKDVLLYWRTRCLPPTANGTLSIMGLIQVRDVAHYLQYYSLPILTALLTPVIRLVLALKQVYYKI